MFTTVGVKKHNAQNTSFRLNDANDLKMDYSVVEHVVNRIIACKDAFEPPILELFSTMTSEKLSFVKGRCLR